MPEHDLPAQRALAAYLRQQRAGLTHLVRRGGTDHGPASRQPTRNLNEQQLHALTEVVMDWLRARFPLLPPETLTQRAERAVREFAASLEREIATATAASGSTPKEPSPGSPGS